jgi:hypothetical protein
MKILAILDLRPGASIETVRSKLREELEGVEDSSAAQRRLSALPLVAADMFDVELIELQPFVNWSRLFRD